MTQETQMVPGRVLVTDGEFKHTLGIVRSLAARGHEVHVIAHSTRAPSVHSRFTRAWHVAPWPAEVGYDSRLAEIAGKLAPVSLIPVGNGAVAAVHRLRDRMPSGVHFALPPRESLDVANDKRRSGDLARSLGMRAPGERVVSDAPGARAALAELGTPLVLKSASEEGRKVLRYVRSERELDAAFAAVHQGSSTAVLAQEYVAGDGWGFSALYWNGTRLRSFMHRRVREWPPSGGTSACAESVPDLPPLAAAGTHLLDALRWHGVAMVEFKGDPARGTLALVEINAKFWGSHDLALAAGVDFPGDLAAMLEGRALSPQAPVRAVRMSWPLGGDLWHGLFRPRALGAVLADAFSSQVAHPWRRDDLGPTWLELLQWARSAPGAFREQRDTK
jgi:predicted ATP-grasp superfamily ATP-dependent carboligase